MAWNERLHPRDKVGRWVRFWHGTTTAGMKVAHEHGEIRPLDVKELAHRLEDEFGLPRDSVWNHAWNAFGRTREGDKNIYLATDRRVAESYARMGNEALMDALDTVFRIQHPEMADMDVTTPEGKQNAADRIAFRADWMRKHDYRPMVVAVDVPVESLTEENRVAGELAATVGSHSDTVRHEPIPMAWVKMDHKRVGAWSTQMSRLHEITRADVEAGRVPGIKYDPTLSGNIVAHMHDRENMTVGPKAFTPDGRADTLLLAHEAGHAVGGNIIARGDIAKTPEIEAFRGKGETYTKGAGYMVTYDNPFGLSSRPEEMLADAYSELLHQGNPAPDPTSSSDDGAKRHALLSLVAASARELGMPDHRIYRFHEDGTVPYEFGSLPPNPPPPKHGDHGDGWIKASDGNTYWGKYGASGVLLAHTDEYNGEQTFFLTHRDPRVDQGDTWGIPGGALNRGDDPLAGALREMEEETGMRPALGRVDNTFVFQPASDWGYTTLTVEVDRSSHRP